MKVGAFLLFFATTDALILSPHHGTARQAIVASSMSRSEASEGEQRRKKIVIVGGGIGGLSTAFDARRLLATKADVHIVSDRDTFQFTPSNPWIGVRKRKPEDITLSLPGILSKHEIAFHHGSAVSLDPKSQTLTLSDKSKIPYDYLVIATGPRLAFEEVPGTGPKGYSKSICTTPHASEAAEAVEALVKDPGPVVIGAVQGASCFGPAYEYALLLNNLLHKRGGKSLVKNCPITFITSEPYIGHLGLKGAGESREILERRFRVEGIEWVTNCRVDKVKEGSVHVEMLHEEVNKKITKTSKHLDSAFTMLIPAFRGSKLWKDVAGLTDKNGMVLVNKFQQSPRYPNVFSVGICTHIDSLEETLIPTGAPKTGYMIESMGTAAVENIRTLIEDENNHKGALGDIPLHSIPTLNGLCITDFGSDGAIFLTLPQCPPRRRDVTIDGRVATLAKIAFERYFMYKIETGDTDPYYETHMLHLIGVDRTLHE